MALFALSSGHIVPARSVELGDGLAAEVLSALRERALDIIDAPLFPVVWEQSDANADESYLVTTDPSGNVVLVNVRASLSASGLFEMLSRSGRYANTKRSEIIAMYPGGAQAFEPAWQKFHDAAPATTAGGARLVIVTLHAEDDLFPVIDTLSMGVRVLEARVYGGGGERYLSVEACHRRTGVPVASAPASAPKASAPAPSGQAPAASEPKHAQPVAAAQAPAEAQAETTNEKRRRRGRKLALRGESAASILQRAPRASKGQADTGAGQAQGAAQGEAAASGEAGIPTSTFVPVQEEGNSAEDATKIPVVPSWKVDDEEVPEDPETPTYMYAMRQQQISRVRPEQVLWERSAPKRDAGYKPETISESYAASASSDAVKRAAEREILSPAGRLLAIASRNRTPLSLTLDRAPGDQASAKLTAWGTLIVGRASFTDPSQAASEALGGKKVDGWRAWTTSDGRSLDEL
ncbi:MAG: hypothetical protein Q3979_02540 [Actinomycetaceae bacterium]|nr:hypothetical protein [Actinomycetaceae bacterium]